MSLSFKLLRLRANLTLEEVAQATGVTRGYLSKIERGLVKPSVGSALKLAKVLNVSVDELFGDAETGDAVVVTRAGEGTPQDTLRGTPRLVASTRGGHRMVAFVMRPGEAREQSHPMSHHEGDELLFVLGGRIRLELPSRVEDLERGDAVQFNGVVPHKITSLSGDEAEVLIVIRVD
ncbi:helix-turn-helix domain-containing protein [Aquabacter sp. P-9]|uniref:helix-turn-helix domain-containing protein n=1 Tax=Aquabacter sediminis TaxID=3029197 RepID=UPI00237DBC23|nr:XRE family transcriptional regulator [Aquabacter sp. P-9]MDE1568952.1 XRE family transcriptional regulator [Aquabacter sp. P-9]